MFFQPVTELPSHRMLGDLRKRQTKTKFLDDENLSSSLEVKPKTWQTLADVAVMARSWPTLQPPDRKFSGAFQLTATRLRRLLARFSVNGRLQEPTGFLCVIDYTRDASCHRLSMARSGSSGSAISSLRLAIEVFMG